MNNKPQYKYEIQIEGPAGHGRHESVTRPEDVGDILVDTILPIASENDVIVIRKRPNVDSK